MKKNKEKPFNASISQQKKSSFTRRGNEKGTPEPTHRKSISTSFFADSNRFSGASFVQLSAVHTPTCQWFDFFSCALVLDVGPTVCPFVLKIICFHSTVISLILRPKRKKEEKRTQKLLGEKSFKCPFARRFARGR